MKTLAVILFIFAAGICGFAADQPKLKVTADGFPSGHDTPEGVACDLARSFITLDTTLFTNTCIRLYEQGIGPTNYAELLRSNVKAMKAEANRIDTPPRRLKAIGRVWAARHLSQTGPATYGRDAFGFIDVMFVDVGVRANNEGETRALFRTLVIQDKDGKWYVHPMPEATPQLSQGLTKESPSRIELSDAYQIQK